MADEDWRAENYGSCQRDSAAALWLNVRNVKAWYRAASACLALDKMPEALDACQTGLSYESSHVALTNLLSRIEKRRDHLAELERARQEREERSARQKATLRLALQARGIASRTTGEPLSVEDAVVALADPLDAKSTLSVPVMLLYPLHVQLAGTPGWDAAYVALVFACALATSLLLARWGPTRRFVM